MFILGLQTLTLVDYVSESQKKNFALLALIFYLQVCEYIWAHSESLKNLIEFIVILHICLIFSQLPELEQPAPKHNLFRQNNYAAKAVWVSLGSQGVWALI